MEVKGYNFFGDDEKEEVIVSKEFDFFLKFIKGYNFFDDDDNDEVDVIDDDI